MTFRSRKNRPTTVLNSLAAATRPDRVVRLAGGLLLAVVTAASAAAQNAPQTTLRLSAPSANTRDASSPHWRPHRPAQLQLSGGVSQLTPPRSAEHVSREQDPAAAWQSQRPAVRSAGGSDDSAAMAQTASYGEPGAGRWRPPARQSAAPSAGPPSHAGHEPLQPKAPQSATSRTDSDRLAAAPAPAPPATFQPAPRPEAAEGSAPIRLETGPPRASAIPTTPTFHSPANAAPADRRSWDETPAKATPVAGLEGSDPPPLEAPAYSLAQAPAGGSGIQDDLAPPPPADLGRAVPPANPIQPPAAPPSQDQGVPLDDLIERARERQREERARRLEGSRDDSLRSYNNLECDTNDEVLRLLHDRKLSDIRIDVTPGFKPWMTPESRDSNLTRNLEAARPRTWRNSAGDFLAEGRLVDYRWGKVYIEQDNGEQVTAAFDLLGADEQCFVSGWWEVPATQRLDGESYQPRAFVASTFTWQASAACYNPLYFEQAALERYGHTVGLMQPVLSGAHFFTSIATLPYQMGIHPPGECRYPLGYYRVGECAPRLLPPVPISLRGALLQAGVWTGGVFALP